MEIDKKSPEARQCLVGLMDYLETVKKQHADEAIHNELIGQAHMENYALKVFLYADNEDRASRFNKNVVKSFYTAGMLFDVLTTFGELSEDIEKNRKYAKWKAAYIHKCLKNGETPLPGPLPDDGEEEGPFGFEGYSADPGGYPQPGPSTAIDSAPRNLYPPPSGGAHAPPSTPQDPPSYYSTPQGPDRPTPTARSRSPQPPSQPVDHDWQPAPNPAGVQLNAQHYQKALKYCKFASSALQYEDAATAIINLQKALKLMTTGQDV